MLENLGNAVGINGRIIPAVNIQVEDVPGFLPHGDGTEAWYGIYFEVMFEPGYLWTVTQGDHCWDPHGKITVLVYHDWAHRDPHGVHNGPDLDIRLAHWDEFLEMYDAKDDRWASVALPVLSGDILSKM